MLRSTATAAKIQVLIHLDTKRATELVTRRSYKIAWIVNEQLLQILCRVLSISA
jgi:hypothetical protein